MTQKIIKIAILMLAMLLYLEISTIAFAEELPSPIEDLETVRGQTLVVALTLLLETEGKGEADMRHLGQLILEESIQKRTSPFMVCVHPYKFKCWRKSPSEKYLKQVFYTFKGRQAWEIAVDMMEYKNVCTKAL